MKDFMRRIECNDPNLDFVRVIEQNEIFELARERLQGSISDLMKSSATFILRRLFTQIMQFIPSMNDSQVEDSKSDYSKHIVNIIFTFHFSVLKTNIHDKIEVYKITILPYFMAEERSRQRDIWVIKYDRHVT